MSRQINCTACRKPMGEIRDAKLRKGIRYICEPCDMQRMETLVELNKLKHPASFFNGIFPTKFM